MTGPSVPKGPTAPKAPAKPSNLPSAAPANEEVFKEDFLGVTAGEFSILPEGFYIARVIDFNREVSKSGNPQYVWQFIIADGEYKGSKLKFWTSLLPQARWKVVQTLEAVGIPCGNSIAEFRRSEIIGKYCVLKVVPDDYNGKETNKIDSVYKANESDVERLTNSANEVPM